MWFLKYCKKGSFPTWSLLSPKLRCLCAEKSHSSVLRSFNYSLASSDWFLVPTLWSCGMSSFHTRSCFRVVSHLGPCISWNPNCSASWHKTPRMLYITQPPIATWNSHWQMPFYLMSLLFPCFAQLFILDKYFSTGYYRSLHFCFHLII